MQRNVGVPDRAFRLVVAVALFAVTFAVHSPLRWIGLLGIIPLVTAFASYCPLYTVAGINTCSRS